MKFVNKIRFIIFLYASFLLASCGFVNDIKDMKKPETVKIKSSGAKYSLPLGQVDFEINKYLNATELSENISSSDVEVYDYNCRGQDSVQEFLFNFPLTSIPLDFGEFLEDLNIEQTLGDGLSQEFSVPGKFDFSTTVDLPDINKLIVSSFVQEPVGLYVTEPGYGKTKSSSDYDWDPLSIEVDFTSPSFKTVEFSTGNLLITFFNTDLSASASFSLNVIPVLYDSEKNEVARSYSPVDVAQCKTDGITVPLDISGAKIEPTMYLVFEGSLENGTEDKNIIYTVLVTMDTESKVSKVSGLNMDTTVIESLQPGSASIPITTSIDMSSLSKFLISAKVSDGSLNYYAEVPSGWHGISCNTNLTISGGISASNSEFMNASESSKANYIVNKTLDLAEKDISPTDINIDGTMYLSFVDASFEFSDSDPTTLTLVGEALLTKLVTVYLDIAKLIDMSEFGQTVEVPFGDSVEQYIDTITFTKLAVNATPETNLDANITLVANLTSTAMNLTAGDGLEDEYAFVDASDDSLFLETDDEWTCDIKPGVTPSLDFNFNMDIKGSDGTIVYMTSMDTSTTYYIKSSVAFDFDWEKVVLNSANTENEGSFDASLNLKSTLNSFFEEDNNEILDNVQFDDISGYIFVTRPTFTATDEVTEDPLKDLNSFTGNVRAIYDDTTVYLIGTEDTDKTMELVQTKTDFTSLADENGTIDDKANPLFPTQAQINQISEGTLTLADLPESYNFSDMVSSSALSEIFNSYSESCSMAYKIKLNSSSDEKLTLTKAAVESLKTDGKCTIELSICMRIPMALSITNNINIEDVLALGGQAIEDDMFNRDSVDDTSNITKYSDLVKSITCTYFIKSTTGLTMQAGFVDDATGINKTIEIGSTEDEHAFGLSSSEIDTILSTYPFTPKIPLRIGESKVQIPRNSYLRFMAYITVETGGEYTVYGD